MPASCVHIRAYCHQTFTEPQPAPTTVSWLREYYEGLLGSIGLKADLARLDDGMRNDFLSMGRHVLNTLGQESSLQDTRIFLLAHQTPDTYFPFRSTTTRLCREFNITAPAIGMTEQELTTPYVALSALLSAFREGRSPGSGLLLILDQGTLPYVRPGYPTSTVDNALALSVGGSPCVNSIAMSGRKCWADPASRKSGWISQSIYAYLDDERIELKDLHIVVDEQMPADATAAIPVATTIADGRLMSPGTLATALHLATHGSQKVLLAHASQDGHLFLFSFHRNAKPDEQEAARCFS